MTSRANTYELLGGGRPPEFVEMRYCPKDEGHWKVDGDRCPVCKSAIKVAVYERRA